MSKSASAPVAPAIVYAPTEGESHVQTIRRLLAAGASTEDILTAYVAARIQTFRERPAHKNKDAKTLAAFVRKHAATHLALARAQMDPQVQAESLGRVEASVDRTRKALAAREAKLAVMRQAVA